MREMAARERVAVPRSPAVMVARWASHPARRSSTRVPAQVISMSSGWAMTARTRIGALPHLRQPDRLALLRGQVGREDHAMRLQRGLQIGERHLPAGAGGIHEGLELGLVGMVLHVAR